MSGATTAQTQRIVAYSPLKGIVFGTTPGGALSKSRVFMEQVGIYS
jgi:hypothetical protein